jgi:hypothetical protein
VNVPFIEDGGVRTADSSRINAVPAIMRPLVTHMVQRQIRTLCERSRSAWHMPSGCDNDTSRARATDAAHCL